MISEVKGKFKQFEFKDSDTDKTVQYNLYIPDNYYSSKSYPLVLFIANSSVVGKDIIAPLTQDMVVLFGIQRQIYNSFVF